jgi:hypothetical protein
MAKKLDPWYISGFVEGEGSFGIIISKHKTKKLRQDARLSFEIELRGDDRPILEKIKKQLDCGNIYELNYDRYGWMPHVKYSVRKFSDIRDKLVPFFRKYPLQGKKAKDYALFCQAMEEVFEEKKHLTREGIRQLEKIRRFMNKRRPFGH